MTNAFPPEERSHAVVIGSSMAGMLAARVLARHFARVTVIERDAAPQGFEPRKGVPQGHHAHVLLKAGEEILSELFPGFLAELEERGSRRVDFGADVHWFHHGAWRTRYPSGIVFHVQSRPLLEGVVRNRLERLPGVTIRHRTVAESLIFDTAKERVVGLRVKDADTDGEGVEEAADLIVDASGRGSRLPGWLTQAGYPAPEEERVGIDIQYASRVYHRPPFAERNWKALFVYQTPPAETRISVLCPIENDRWLVSLGGYLGDHSPSDDAGYLAYAKGLARPDIYEAIREAKPASDVSLHRVPYARWRHYERLARFPGGILPIGDSVCSFDPVFGQGMTVAAKGARALGLHLEKASLSRAGDARPLLRTLAGEVATPWLLATSENFRYPQMEGRRPPGLAILQRYTREVIRLSGSDPVVYGHFLRVLHLLDGPETLFRPSVLLRVLGSMMRGVQSVEGDGDGAGGGAAAGSTMA